MKHRQISLSESQLSIMQALWEMGEADVQQVCDALASDTKAPAYTTVSTLLKRLEKRNLVQHRREGRKQIFAASVSEEQVQSSMVNRLVGSLFRGNSDALVSHLLEADSVDKGDLDEIRKLIAEAKKS